MLNRFKGLCNTHFNFQFESGFSLYEIVLKCIEKLNEVIDLVNGWLTGVPDELKNVVNEKINDGSFGKLINDGLLGDINTKLNAIATIKNFGAIGDGIADDSSAILLAESSKYDYINLLGMTVNTNLTLSQIRKNYYNGFLIVDNGKKIYKKNISPYIDFEIQRRSTKSPILEWDNKNVLWLGTSIPHIGGTLDSYPILFGKMLNCNVYNNAWAGSHNYFNPIPNATIETITSLSMTEDDRKAWQGMGGAWNENFDEVTKASEMTCDFRIKNSFAAKTIDCVILDHAHNDAGTTMGTLSPETKPITYIVKGNQTSIDIPNHNFVVGDAVSILVDGIPNLNHASARVQNVVGNTIVININSSSYSGNFVSGQAIKLDRKTFFGGFEFVLHYIMNCRIIYNSPNCEIVLASPPNNYSAFSTTPDIMHNASILVKKIADKWGLSFFDIGNELNIDEKHSLIYFGDGWHPTTFNQKKLIADYWVKWAKGGCISSFVESDFLMSGSDKNYKINREAMYSPYYGGFSTANFVTGNLSELLVDNFSDGDYTGWTIVGDSPTVQTSPWDVNEKAIYFNGLNTGLSKAVAFNSGKKIKFDLLLPVTNNLINTGVKQLNLCEIGTEISSVIQLIINKVGCSVRTLSIDDNVSLHVSKEMEILPNVKYSVEIHTIKADDDRDSVTMFYINGNLIDRVTNFTDKNKTTSDKVSFGSLNSNCSVTIPFYIGNIGVYNIEVFNFSKRYTGNIVTNGGTLKVVNGIICELS